MNAIGNKVRSLREEAGMTQLELGIKAGCSGQVISNIERGYSSPAANLLGRLADSLGVSSDYLMDNIAQYDIKLSDEEKELILQYRKMTPKGKRLFAEILNITLEEI